jgi:Ca-activated chloride channel family protein
MHEPDPQFDANLEDKLRGVPLPEGLLRRLRQTALADDDGLDEAVRELRVPAGFEARLQAALYAEDDVLDEALGAVSVPVGLTARLRRAVLLDDDDALDEALRSVPMPASVLRRPRWGLLRRWRLDRAARVAVAASLFLAVGLLYGGGVATFFIARQPSIPPMPAEHEIALTMPAVDAEGLDAPLNLAPEWPSLGSLADDPESWATSDVPLERPDEPVFAGRDELADLFGAWRRGTGFDPRMTTTDAWLDPGRAVYGIGVRDDIDSLPELRKVPGPVPQGMQPPYVGAFPIIELNETGVFPWVMPRAHPRLQTWHVPLLSDTSSYELTRRYLEDRQLPPPEQVRTEEFLAAMDYGFAAPKQGPLAVSAAAGPSPFGGEGVWLMQVGVQARPPTLGKHPPIHLVVALDASGSMQWAGRIDMAREALGDLFRQLGPDDRVTLVSYAGEARVWFEDAGIEEAEAMSAMLATVPVGGGTNVAAGLSAAYDAALRLQTPQRAVRVVLLSDGGVQLDRGTSDAVEAWAANAARQNVPLSVVDLSQGADADRLLRQFAARGRGKAFRATSASQITWALRDTLTGTPQRVADDVRLLVTFNPKVVAGYRFFGHEPSALGRLNSDLPRVDFHAGQSATGLFEMRLLGGDQEIASVEVSWQPTGGGPRQRLVHKVHGRDLATDVSQMAPSLQTAALAARTAEALRVPRRGRPMAELLAVARLFDGSLQYRPSYQQLLGLIEQADRARPSRSRF